MMILDGETLFRYADPKILPEGQEELPLSIFNDKEMSCDWDKYQKSPESSPHVTSGRSLLISINVCEDIRFPKNPRRVGEVVPAWEQVVVYDPLSEQEGNIFTPNESHSLIKGKKKAAVTTALRNNSTFKNL
ncbi:hypothetical protein AB6C94_12410 [Vibrio splendidus]|uniref:hypothetical protein n=1 Tax=Vibrio gallaecicus TaxID=552386 RepID=UPI0010C9A18B|nr:hypothetical protein [Vibrio gallaecicus]MDN3614675.1 hypothetical protein [Vibrio gallaecicus]MDN3615712.1 hypothetical protein [Vibrio gallaecicus]MDN3615751.1 hypothetical protein [Vibrio gallaecicus]MDN3615886.1 hypothetical protein [Vibrio gallaecicus]